mmetsp:Transcript_17945/g.44488  ORF Transcript_17945/g.44488 Transcript_17945/m.44488 type:complete len:374 (+) Transcript_17945:244-1365(+)
MASAAAAAVTAGAAARGAVRPRNNTVFAAAPSAAAGAGSALAARRGGPGPAALMGARRAGGVLRRQGGHRYVASPMAVLLPRPFAPSAPAVAKDTEKDAATATARRVMKGDEVKGGVKKGGGGGAGKKEKLRLRIDGQWYDCTGWAKAHPGGAVFVQLMDGCDCTDVFYALHSYGPNGDDTAARRLNMLPKCDGPNGEAAASSSSSSPSSTSSSSSSRLPSAAAASSALRLPPFCHLRPLARARLRAWRALSPLRFESFLAGALAAAAAACSRCAISRRALRRTRESSCESSGDSARRYGPGAKSPSRATNTWRPPRSIRAAAFASAGTSAAALAAAAEDFLLAPALGAGELGFGSAVVPAWSSVRAHSARSA